MGFLVVVAVAAYLQLFSGIPVFWRCIVTTLNMAGGTGRERQGDRVCGGRRRCYCYCINDIEVEGGKGGRENGSRREMHRKWQYKRCDPLEP